MYTYIYIYYIYVDKSPSSAQTWMLKFAPTNGIYWKELNATHIPMSFSFFLYLWTLTVWTLPVDPPPAPCHAGPCCECSLFGPCLPGSHLSGPCLPGPCLSGHCLLGPCLSWFCLSTRTLSARRMRSLGAWETHLPDSMMEAHNPANAPRPSNWLYKAGPWILLYIIHPSRPVYVNFMSFVCVWSFHNTKTND